MSTLIGRDAEALALAERAEALTDDPVLRAECAFVLGVATLRRGRPADAIPTLVAAASAVAPHDAGRAAELLMQATSAAWQTADASAVLEIARIAKAVVPPDGDATALFFRGVILGFAAMMNGDHAEAARCLEPAIAHGALTDQTRHAFLANLAALWLGDDEAASALVGRAIRLARASGEVGELVDRPGRALGAAHHRAAQRRGGGRRPRGGRARARAERGEHPAAAARRARDPRRDPGPLRGVPPLGEEVIAVALAKGLPNRVSLATYALAVDDINRARWAEALERFDTMAEQGTGDADPVMAALMLPDKVEAAVRAGRPELAREALRLFEAWATHSGARFAAPRLAGCRALLAEGEEATEHFEAMLALADDARPLDLARMRMQYGEHLRRERRRTDARTQFRAALATFEAYRAEPLAERARAELRATGETARKRDPSTIDQLTPQELQIARFVASGLSNKEVAAQLFLSPRTVDAHLRKVFTKLGITSRTQLARQPLGEPEELGEPALA